MSTKKKYIGLAIFLITLGIIVILLGTMITIVEAGHVGVYDLFGEVSEDEYQPGLHLKHPLANIIQMSTRTEEYTMSYTKGEGAKSESDIISALTKEGLTVDLDITVWYKLDPEAASDVYKTLGVGYVGVIVRPQIRTAIRDVVVRYEAKDIYGDKRQIAALEIFDEMKNLERKRETGEVTAREGHQDNAVLSYAIALKIDGEMYDSVKVKRTDKW